MAFKRLFRAADAKEIKPGDVLWNTETGDAAVMKVVRVWDNTPPSRTWTNVFHMELCPGPGHVELKEPCCEWVHVPLEDQTDEQREKSLAYSIRKPRIDKS
jgi:hypothetical protein